MGRRRIVSCGALPSTASRFLDIAAADRRSVGQPAVNRYSCPVFDDHEQRSVSGVGMAGTFSPFGNPLISWTVCSHPGGTIAPLCPPPPPPAPPTTSHSRHMTSPPL